MSNLMTDYNAKDFVGALKKKGYLKKEKEVEALILKETQERELPIYLRALAGFGAFIASICFIAFLGITEIIDFDSKGAMALWGAVFIANALVFQRNTGDGNTVRHSFMMQTSFASMAVGKIFFVIGLESFFQSSWGVPIAIFIITAVTYNVYRMSIDRFLSVLSALISVLTVLLFDNDQLINGLKNSREITFNIFFLCQLVGAGIFFTHGKIKRAYIPMAYAFAASLCASVLFVVEQNSFRYWGGGEVIGSISINAMLVVALVALICWASGGFEKLKKEPVILASCGAVLLGIISVPGIILSIGGMVLGYAKHEKILMHASALLMPVFLIYYYYNLDVSLLEKSGILVGSGIVLLAGRFYLKFKDWDKGGAS